MRLVKVTTRGIGEEVSTIYYLNPLLMFGVREPSNHAARYRGGPSEAEAGWVAVVLMLPSPGVRDNRIGVVAPPLEELLRDVAEAISDDPPRPPMAERR